MAGMISYLRPHTTKKGDAMAFAALEDLHGRVDIIFFPRTWKQVRELVQMDQILVIQGKVQVRDDSITIIVDRAQKTVEMAKDADAIYEQEKARPTQKNGFNGHGNGVVSVPSRIAEPVPTLDAAPPPPPPPNFEAEEMATSKLAPAPMETAVKQERTSPPPAMPKPVKKNRTVVIEVKPVGNWREACRQALAKTGQYEGRDQLSVRLAGSHLAMEFPNQSTRLCPDLLESLRMVPGIARVYEG